MAYTQIKYLGQLTALLEKNKDGYTDMFINLGGIRSSKALKLRGYNKQGRASFYVLNEIDGTTQLLTEDSIYTRSNIGNAMDMGNFYAY